MKWQIRSIYIEHRTEKKFPCEIAQIILSSLGSNIIWGRTRRGDKRSVLLFAQRESLCMATLKDYDDFDWSLTCAYTSLSIDGETLSFFLDSGFGISLAGNGGVMTCVRGIIDGMEWLSKCWIV